MKRKIEFEYFFISNGYAEGVKNYSLVYLTEPGIKLLDEILTKYGNKKPKEKSVSHD